VSALPGFVDDLVPYPANARPGASRSIYDEQGTTTRCFTSGAASASTTARGS
jgi:hypothetical protein